MNGVSVRQPATPGLWRGLFWLYSCLATLVGTLTSPAGASGNSPGYANSRIADIALEYVGGWGGKACIDAHRSGMTGSATRFPAYPIGYTDPPKTGATIDPEKGGDGQCRSFVNCVVWIASARTQWLGGQPDGTYFGAFLAVGGSRVANTAQLMKGDIVQVGNGSHTFIIVKRISDSDFDVVDSNSQYDEHVHEHRQSIVLSATERAYRLGSVATSASQELIFSRGHYLYPKKPHDENAVETSVWRISPTGVGLKRLFGVPKDDEIIPESISPDGQTIALTRGFGTPHVWLMNRDGTGAHALGQSPGLVGFGARFSPSGSELVYRRILPADELVLSSLTGTGSHTIGPVPAGLWGFTWSPGDQFVYSLNDGLYERQFPNGPQHRLISGAAIGNRTVTQISFTPDGREMALSTNPGPLYVARSDGSALHAVSATAGAQEPALSPDGNQVAYYIPRKGMYEAPVDGHSKPALLVKGAVWGILWAP